jgi:predicted negative regulator of RcsB-dependent stress response
MTAAENAEQRRLSDAVTELEEAWHKEDEEMLIRLVKIRRSMWT